MTKPILVIANKNYSSWSMRPWVLLRELGVDFEEVQLKFDSVEWQAGIARRSPSGLVPVLWLEGEPIWDSLAIVETVAERWPEKSVWPRDPKARINRHRKTDATQRPTTATGISHGQIMMSTLYRRRR